MSELQISLLAIGLLIVAGVYGFNRYQERRYRRIAEKAFPARQEDVLLESGTNTLPDTLTDAHEIAGFREESRIEPIISMPPEEMPVELAEELAAAEVSIEQIEPVSAVESQPEERGKPLHEDRPVVSQDETINYRVQLHPSESVGAAALIEAIQRQGDFGKRVHWLGMNSLTGGWEEVGQGSAEEYLNIAATLQLADRTGPVSDSDLAAFCSQVQTVADELVAVAEFPKRQPALALAAALDQFCADVDVLIGANIITQNGEAFAATKVRAMSEAAGMKLQPDGAFHYINDEGADLFSLANLDPTPFSAENIRHLSTHGITFLFDVPRVADGVRVFNQMLTVARQMASSLGGQVVDDNRRPLSDAGIARIKQQLADIYARMEAQQIKSGSARALRLFS
ncbi:cell division protein FtsZ [Sulfuricella sp. T08]|uniref:cell division protein ZipA C-terminal FtsZ-binding domain-containing protein n=1 Tax=Sulfuricella sp. T08 TaxID=1632857 RepID=UPI0006179F94|nr:cell division protein ZipA C-terminal FtsZ-binding domain-containing protein [Sulfuricella sp. T08]GAO35703.1 cell division protein FtsZ [Sulfuricella sp. T08]